MFLQQHETSLLKLALCWKALNVDASNAGPEQDFSLVTWLSSGRKSQSGVPTLTAQLGIMRNGLPVREVPQFFRELTVSYAVSMVCTRELAVI